MSSTREQVMHEIATFLEGRLKAVLGSGQFHPTGDKGGAN